MNGTARFQDTYKCCIIQYLNHFQGEFGLLFAFRQISRLFKMHLFCVCIWKCLRLVLYLCLYCSTFEAAHPLIQDLKIHLTSCQKTTSYLPTWDLGYTSAHTNKWKAISIHNHTYLDRTRTLQQFLLLSLFIQHFTIQILKN